MLQTLQGAGWEVVGTERSADSAMHARRLGLDVLVGDVTRHGLPAGAFDLVILWHVLEHLYDPRATLVAVRRLMPPSGRLVIAVPNASSWQARLAGRRWFHLDVPRHLYHFDPTTLEALLHSSGFRIHRWSRASPAYELRGWWELAGDTTARNTATRASASLAALALTALSTTAACHKISAAIAVQASPVCLPRDLV